MYRFLENKDHLIDRLDLTPDQKEELKAFFAKHPSYENKVDWNNKSLSYKDFESLLALDGKSKTQAKKNGLSGLIEGKDYFDFGEADVEDIGNCHLYQPLSYLGSKILASNAVPPVRDNGAKWCISYQKTNEYWNTYTRKGIKFLFVFTKDTKHALTIYPEKIPLENEVYSFGDKNLRWPDWCGSPEIAECIANLREIPKPSLAELLDKYRGILVKNPDGTVDKVGDKTVDLLDFINNSRFICRFNRWESDFDCNGMALVSLEGAPREIEGDFNCSDNNLTSLEGAPIEVRGGFYCYSNHLTSLAGAPIKVGGSFYCYSNHLTSLEGAPKEVGGGFNCSFNNLISLEGAPKEVGGSFYCQTNNLNSLKGAPIKVRVSFNCRNNNLTSLEGAPEKIGGNFYCDINDLVSLEGAPEIVGGDFSCRNNNLTSLEGAPEKVGGDFYHDGLKG